MGDTPATIGLRTADLPAQVSEALAPELEALEATRRRKHRGGKLAFGLGFACGLLGFIFSLLVVGVGDGLVSDVATVIFGLGPMIAGAAYAGRKDRNWDQVVAQRIIAKITGPIGQMTYLPDASKRFKIKEVDGAPMFPAFVASEARHYLEGTHRGVGFRIASVKLKKTRGKHIDIIWTGLVAKIDVPEPSPGTIWIGRDYHRKFKALTGLFKAQPTRLEPVPGDYPVALEVRAAQPDAVAAYLPPGFFEVLRDIIAEDAGGAPAFGMVFDGGTVWLTLEGDHDFLGALKISEPVRYLNDRLPRLVRDVTLPHRIIDRLAGDEA